MCACHNMMLGTRSLAASCTPTRRMIGPIALSTMTARRQVPPHHEGRRALLRANVCLLIGAHHVAMMRVGIVEESQAPELGVLHVEYGAAVHRIHVEDGALGLAQD